MVDLLLTEQEQTTAKEIIEKLLETLTIEGTFELTENEDTLEVALETKDAGIIIGYHGEILESLQLITALMLARSLGKFTRVSIEVDGYKKNRIAYLEKLAQQTKEKALGEGTEQVLTSLKSWERRVVHLSLQDDDQVTSESSGEGRERVLVIKPK